LFGDVEHLVHHQIILSAVKNADFADYGLIGGVAAVAGSAGKTGLEGPAPVGCPER
jgi:hypothetical protein